jgi:hypothetical protein
MIAVTADRNHGWPLTFLDVACPWADIILGHWR